MRYDPLEEERQRQGCMWKAIIIALIVGIMLFAGIGLATTIDPVFNYRPSTTIYNTTTNNVSIDILSGNSEVVGVVGLTIVLIFIAGTLRRGRS